VCVCVCVLRACVCLSVCLSICLFLKQDNTKHAEMFRVTLFFKQHTEEEEEEEEGEEEEEEEFQAMPCQGSLHDLREDLRRFFVSFDLHSHIVCREVPNFRH